jgi:hypothetical protein
MKKIIVLTALFAMVFAGTALAADWNFYGSSRMALFSSQTSKDYTYNTTTGYTTGTNPVLNPLATGVPATAKDHTTTSFGQQGNSRIGANVAAGDVKGRFEYGTAVNLRLLYGTWNFGSGEMSVGQMYNPTYFGLSNQVFDGDNGLAGFGAPFSRRPAIEFKFGAFKVAAVQPQTATVTGFTTGTRVTLPKIEAAYNGAFGPVNLHVSGGYNSVDAFNAQDQTKSITSMVGQVMAKYNAGPFMVGGSFMYGVNMANYGWNVRPAGAAGAVIPAGSTEVKDTTTMGYTLVVGFTINDMLGVEGGLGYTVNSFDTTVNPNDDPAMAYYVQLPITLADGVFIIPEIGKHDADVMGNAAKTKEGDIQYFGAKFQINF